MLSPGAFNALLKTIEEPPSHAVFILATTEIYKVPITILSRCQRYDFRRIPTKIIEDRLKEAKQEACLVLLYDEDGPERASIEHGDDLSWIDDMMKRLYEASSLRKIKGTYHDITEMATAVAKAARNLECSKE